MLVYGGVAVWVLAALSRLIFGARTRRPDTERQLLADAA
jgi:hypothetical protein